MTHTVRGFVTNEQPRGQRQPRKHSGMGDVPSGDIELWLCGGKLPQGMNWIHPESTE